MSRTFFNPVALTSLILSVFLLAPVLSSGIKHNNKDLIIQSSPNTLSIETAISEESETEKTAVAALYDTLNLDKAGMSQEVLEYAVKGYEKLVEKGEIVKEGIISICDFSQSSRKKRLYIIDIINQKLLVNTFVAHGKNSGLEYAKSFSNKPESHKSSLGFYVTANSYFGSHGLAMKIKGMENGINDKAWDRAIVVHGSDYVNAQFARNNGYMGRSFGCPAISYKDTEKVINTIKNGTCLFIYHPSDNYLNQSKIINS